MIWCILGVLFLRFMCPMDCSCMINFIEVPLKGKNKILVKILGGRQQVKYWKVATPATPAALTPTADECDALRSDSEINIMLA